MAWKIHAENFDLDQDRLNTFLPVRDQFTDMKIVGVRLPAPVEGVVDYADLRTHAEICRTWLWIRMMMPVFFTLPAPPGAPKVRN